MQLEIEVSNYNLGVDYFKNQNYKESVLYFTKAIEDNPIINFSQAYLWRGISHYFLSNYESAIQDFNEAGTGLQNEVRIHNWRALSFKEIGNYAAAIKDLKMAIDLDPNFREPYVDLYEIGFLSGNFELTNEYFYRLIELDRSNINLFIARADNNAKAGKYDLSTQMCDFVLNKVADERNSLQIRGTCHANLMNYGLAQKDFSKYIELNPNDPTGYFNRAVLLRQINKDGANRDFLQAYELGMPSAKDYITG